MNAAGVGAFFNLMNFGQMYSYHVFLLPVIVVVLVVAHVLLVRRHGVVPPFVLEGLSAGTTTDAAVTDGADSAPAAGTITGDPLTTDAPPGPVSRAKEDSK